MKIRRILAVVVVAATAAVGLGPVHAASAGTTLVDIRAARHPGFDRVVFEFRGPLPHFREVRYVSTVTREGRPTRVVGDARLQVAMRKVFTATGRDGGPGYGAARERYDLRNVTEVVDTRIYDVDAEDGGAAFGIGLVRRQPFRVFTLRNPSRLVIDIGSRFAARRVSVYFSDIERRPGEPAIVAVRRSVDSPAVARGALQRLFAGLTQPEIARGLQFFPGRVTGFSDLSVRDGVARVRLLGGCPAPSADIRRQVRLTLLQFPTVEPRPDPLLTTDTRAQL
jgi:hypothetical protein